MDVGKRIRALRKSKGMTLEQLADKINLSISFLSDIENGRSNPSLDRLCDLAKALETRASFLLGECDSVESSQSGLDGLQSVPGFSKIAEELMDIASWSESDKQELLAYLRAKRIARKNG